MRRACLLITLPAIAGALLVGGLAFKACESIRKAYREYRAWRTARIIENFAKKVNEDMEALTGITDFQRGIK